MAHVYAVAYTHTCSITNLHAVSDSPSRADIHAVPDLYTLAHIDTYTCANSHGDTDPHADCDCAYTYAGANTYSYFADRAFGGFARHRHSRPINYALGN